MSKTSMIFGAISAVSAAFACCLGGLCLFGYISDERRKQKMESDAESAAISQAISQLIYDVNELELKMTKYENLLQEKK